MNKVTLVGRLAAETELKGSEKPVCRYTLAVDRKYKVEGQPEADFIRCVAFGRSAEFADKYFSKGMRVAVSGRITTGSYTNRDGVKVYTTEVAVEDQEFAQSKNETRTEQPEQFSTVEETELPFA